MSTTTEREPGAAGGAGLVLALALAVTTIAFAAIFFRLADPMHPLLKAGARLVMASLLLAVPTWRAYRAGRLPPTVLRAGVLAGLLYALHFGSWVASLTMTSIAASVTLVTATPLLLAVAGLWTGRDRPSRQLWVALAIAGAGLLLIGGRDLSASSLALAGDALAFLGAAAMAAYLLVARAQGDRLDVLAFTGVATGVGGVLLLAIALVAGIDFAGLASPGLLWLLMAALFPQLVGHSLLTWSLRHTTPTTVGLATLAEPVGSTMLGALLLAERPDLLIVVGCGVTLCGVAVGLLARDESR